MTGEGLYPALFARKFIHAPHAAAGLNKCLVIRSSSGVFLKTNQKKKKKKKRHSSQGRARASLQCSTLSLSSLERKEVSSSAPVPVKCYSKIHNVKEGGFSYQPPLSDFLHPQPPLWASLEWGHGPQRCAGRWHASCMSKHGVKLVGGRLGLWGVGECLKNGGQITGACPCHPAPRTLVQQRV